MAPPHYNTTPQPITALLSLVLVLLSFVILLPGQTIPEDELRTASREYLPRSSNAIRVESNLVEVPVVVRNDKGAFIGGLKQNDFEIYDDGKKEVISLFTVRPAPVVPPSAPTTEAVPDAALLTPARAATPSRLRYIALYFDDFSMPEGDLPFARNAAEQFINESLQPADRVGIFTSSTTVSLNFTDDKQKILDTLGQLRTHQRRADQGPLSCPRIIPYQAYLINHFWNTHSDAFDLAVEEARICGNCGTQPASLAACVRTQAQQTQALTEQFSRDTLGIISDVVQYLSKMSGQRILVLTSSGFWTQTVGSLQDKLIERALHAAVVINSLDSKGLYTQKSGGELSDGPPIMDTKMLQNHPDMPSFRDKLASDQKQYFNDPMAILAEGTGGRFFHNNNDLGRGMREMAALPETSYVLGFSPDNLKPNGSLHNLKVKLPELHNVAVESRRAYYALESPKKGQNTPSAKRDELDRAVSANDSAAAVSAELAITPITEKNGDTGIKVAIHVDVRSLPFQRLEGRSVERLIMVTALFDSENHFLVGVEGVMDLHLKNTTLKDVTARGLDASFSLRAPRGSYHIRQVVQEEVKGRLMSVTRAVQIQ